MSTPDFTLENHGSVCLLRSHTVDGLAHVREHVADAMWWGDALVVEHRFAIDLALRLNEHGYTVRLEN